MMAGLLMASAVYAESLDGTYLCEGEQLPDGSGDVSDSSVMEIKGKTVKNKSIYGEHVYERIYEHNDSDGYNRNHQLFISVSHIYGEVIMINKTKNKRDINVSTMAPQKTGKRNDTSYTHCKKI